MNILQQGEESLGTLASLETRLSSSLAVGSSVEYPYMVQDINSYLL